MCVTITLEKCQSRSGKAVASQFVQPDKSKGKDHSNVTPTRKKAGATDKEPELKNPDIARLLAIYQVVIPYTVLI